MSQVTLTVVGDRLVAGPATRTIFGRMVRCEDHTEAARLRVYKNGKRLRPKDMGKASDWTENTRP